MKALKILGIVLGAIVILAAVLVGAALTPSVQTWAVRRALAGQPEVDVTVGRVAAGLSAAEVEEVRFAQSGLVVTVKGLSAQYSAWDFLTQNRINVDRATAREVVVDLRQFVPPPADAGAESTPFTGVLQAAQLPWSIRLAELNADVRVLLPEDRTVAGQFRGAGIESGQTGTLSWTIDFADPAAEAALQSLHATGQVEVGLTADSRVASVDLATTVAATGPQLPSDRWQLTAQLAQAAPGENERYATEVALLRGGQSESLLQARADYRPATGEIAGTWELAVRSEQLAALLAGLGWPEVAAQGRGRWQVQPATAAATLSGTLEAEAAHLDKLAPELAAVGGVRVRLAFDGGLADSTAQLDQLELVATATDGREIAEIRALQKIQYQTDTQRLLFASPGTELAQIAVRSLPLAWAQPWVEGLALAGGDLSLTLALEAEPDGSRVRARAREPLALRAVTLRQGEQTLVEGLNLTAQPHFDYAAPRLTATLKEIQLSLPAGDSLAGELSADLASLTATPLAIAFTARLQAQVVKALAPYLPLDPGLLALDLAGEGRLDGETLRLTQATVRVDRGAGGLLTAVELLQPFQAHLTTLAVAAARPDEPAARVQLGEVPLAWAESFVENAHFAGKVQGGGIELTLRSLEDLAVATIEPVDLRGVSVELEGDALAQEVDLTLDLSATKRGAAVTYDVRRLSVHQGETRLAELGATGEATLGAPHVVSAQGRLEADVAALLRQPVLQPFATLARGQVSGTFTARLADGLQGQAQLTARDLVAQKDQRPLGQLELSLDATLAADGRGQVAAPVKLTQGERQSDLTLRATFEKAENPTTWTLNGKLESQHLVVDDFLALADLAPASPEAPAPTGPRPSPSPNPSEPFWKGIRGTFALTGQRVLYGADFAINDLVGTATLTDERLALERLAGKFNDFPFAVTTTLTFEAGHAQPFALAGSADVAGVDVGALLKAANPAQPPQVETVAKMQATFNGRGTTLDELAKQVQGTFALAGGKGTLRLLGGRTGQVASATSAIAGIAGALMQSGSTVAAASLVREFTNMPFEEFTLQAERGADGHLVLRSVEFLSPSMRLTGSGRAVYQPGAAITAYPIQLEMSLAGKQHLQRMLDEARVLGSQPDEKGYMPMRAAIKLQGTVAQMEDNLKSVLASTALQMGLDLLGGSRR